MYISLTNAAKGDDMKAWVHYGFSDMRLEEIPYPRLQHGWVILRVRVVQPSITEALLSQGLGTLNTLVKSVEKRMKQKPPVQLFGHELAGEVVEVGEGVDALRKGDRVTADAHLACHKCHYCKIGARERCLNHEVVGFDIPGAFAEYVALPAEILFKLPDTVSNSEGACIQPLSECVAAVGSARVNTGDTVVIIGQGVMGLSTMQAARVSGAGKVIGIDVRQEALRIAAQLGADETINAERVDPIQKVRELTENRGADIVVEAAGGSTKMGLAGTMALQQAAEMVTVAGKIIQIAHLEKPLENFDTGLFRTKAVKWLYPDFASAQITKHTINLVASKRITLKPLITHVLEGIDKLPEALEITMNKSKYGAINPAQVRIID